LQAERLHNHVGKGEEGAKCAKTAATQHHDDGDDNDSFIFGKTAGWGGSGGFVHGLADELVAVVPQPDEDGNEDDTAATKESDHAADDPG